MTKKTHKSEQLKGFLFDVKAEVVVAHWLENLFINEHQLLVKFDGQHERGVGKDIKKAHYIDPKNENSEKWVDITLNRDSIYDTLPEVLFHYPKKRSQKVGADTMAEDYRHRKTEEQTARTFFNPFDQILFLQRTFIEQQESVLSTELNQFLVENSFYDYLFIDSSLPSFLKSRFLCFLPYLDKIIGNFDLTARCLALLLDFDVTWKYKRSQLYSQEQVESRLGMEQLGVNFILSSSIEDTQQSIMWEIGPTPKSEVIHCINNGHFIRLFSLFAHYFVPLEIESIFKVRVNSNENEFCLNAISTNEGRMGFTTKI